jgi:hypothetical protein
MTNNQEWQPPTEWAPTPIASGTWASQPIALTEPVAAAEYTVLHRFQAGRRHYSIAIYPDCVTVIPLTPPLGGLGALISVVLRARRSKRVGRQAAAGPAALASTFRNVEVVGRASIAQVAVRPGVLNQQVLTVHRNDGGASITLPYPKRQHSIERLWYAFWPLVGHNFVVEPGTA